MQTIEIPKDLDCLVQAAMLVPEALFFSPQTWTTPDKLVQVQRVKSGEWYWRTPGIEDKSQTVYTNKKAAKQACIEFLLARGVTDFQTKPLLLYGIRDWVIKDTPLLLEGQSGYWHMRVHYSMQKDLFLWWEENKQYAAYAPANTKKNAIKPFWDLFVTSGEYLKYSWALQNT